MFRLAPQAPADPTAEPIRPAATVILWRDGVQGREILMGQRGARAVFMPSKYVFPGGGVDPDDHHGLDPLLHATCQASLARDCPEGAPSAATLARAALRELHEETGLRPDPAHPLRFVFRAITPPGRSRRFDARFFLVPAQGVMGDAETFRDFVKAGLVWREVVRAKYGGGVTITEAEIDRAIANFQPTGASRLQLLELVLPGENGDLSGAQAVARRLQVQIETEADFAASARANSKGETAGSGGSIGWQRLSALPEASRSALARLAPGGMSRPVLLEDRVVIYWLVERGEDPLGQTEGTWVDYAQFLVPEGANAEAELAAARAKADTCDDLYTVAKGLPEDRLLRESQPQSAVGGDIGAVLATLDAGETSTRISRNGWRVLMMLCSRGPAPDLQPEREVVREQLDTLPGRLRFVVIGGRTGSGRAR